MTTPTHALKDRIGKLGRDLARAGTGAWLIGLGALATAEEETCGWIGRLKAKGEKLDKESGSFVARTLHRMKGRVGKLGGTAEGAVQRAVGTVLHRAGVPSREEIRTLIDRVEQLATKMDKLGASR